jgi:hypothetical protein
MMITPTHINPGAQLYEDCMNGSYLQVPFWARFGVSATVSSLHFDVLQGEPTGTSTNNRPFGGKWKKTSQLRSKTLISRLGSSFFRFQSFVSKPCLTRVCELIYQAISVQKSVNPNQQ